MPGLALLVQEHFKRDPFAGDVFVFRGRGGSLIKAIWHDGLGLSLYAKRLDRGRFIWPQTTGGVVALTTGQMSYLLEGIDWRNPQATWRPARARGKLPGRQPVNADKVKAALKLVEAGLSPTKAASQLGLGRSTVYREVAAAGLPRKAS